MTTLPTAGAVAPVSRPTMRDVAERAGVSLKTVSRALNGEPGVHPETSARVLQAAGELRFRRNESAATLRRSGQRTRSIGLVIEDVANPFFAALTKGVEDVARERGYLLVAGSSNQDAAVERRLIQELCSRRVEGLLVVPSGPDLGYLSDEIALGTPVVSVDRPAPGVDTDAVLLANVDGVRAGVAHLIAHGHRRIAFVGDTARHTGAQRLAGYRQALAEAGLPVDETLACAAHGVDAAEAAASELLDSDDPPTAFFTGNNLLTQGVLEALGPRRHTVALVGFDDFAFADLLDPPVTVVGQHAEELGRNAALQLFRRIDGDQGPIQQVVLGTRLTARGSGELTPAPTSAVRRPPVAARAGG